MSEWRETNVSEIIELIGGGTPKTKMPEYWGGDIPWLSVVDFNTGNKFVFDTEKKITQAGLKHSSTKLLEAGDIIISARGTVGVVAMLGKQMAFNQSCYGVKAIDQKSTNNYVYYLLKDAVSNFLQIAHGGVFDTITRDTFKEIDISLPPLPEQKAIAEVLSSLDDKIDLLHRQNKTLEQMAETLFRQWFVEEAGEDWEETTLGEVIRIGSGKGLKKDKFIESGKYPILGANGEIGRTDEYLFNDRLIFTGRVGTLGNVFRIESEKVWLSDNTLVIQPKKYYNFIYFVLKSAKIDQYNVGSTQPLVRQSDIKEIEIILSEDNIHAEFEIQSNVLFEKINKNQTQIRTLEKLRDTLLPKLMSGEVRVN